MSTTKRFVVLGLGVLLGSLTIKASASLQMLPQRLFLDDQSRSAQVEVFNRSGETQEYRVIVADEAVEEDGSTELIDPVEPGAEDDRAHYGADFLRYHPRQMTLAPGENQTVRVMARVPDGVDPGEYRARLAVRTMPSRDQQAFAEDELDDDEIALEVETLFAMTIPVAILHGEAEAEPRIASAQWVAAEGDGDPRLDVAVEREGERGAYGSLEVYDAENPDEPLWVRNRAVVSSAMEQRTFGFTADNPAIEAGDEVRVVYRAFDDPEDGFGEAGGHVKTERTLKVN
ncbi:MULTISPECIES: hypothetical protein [unclassified Halorhodospira]|uniref:hypothetical protein n=1 Tax=unclassified Halorhodospira TaxID=2626748 RepID=UPI001EE828DC|nr:MULTISPECIES: hypothetical protein [unclassified Halorhodospira]MCG5541420.1 hypothetical protein [Halorhodospira sp. M39old]MCG5546414.1 hypothetical protein [Halorhodospira sp. M38]